jgi:hypothetical protein
LTYYYTQDPDLPWYETPTCLAGYFVAGGYLSVALNAMITALVCRLFTFLTHTQRDPAVLSALFAAACIINLQMPVTGWLSIAPIIGVVVSVAFLKVISVINRNREPRKLQPMPETLAPAH